MKSLQKLEKKYAQNNIVTTIKRIKRSNVFNVEVVMYVTKKSFKIV